MKIHLFQCDRLICSRLMIMLVLLAAAGCSSVQTKSDDPALLMKEAEQEISNDHYLLALDKLREIKNKFPYSKFAVDAQLRLADVYFIQESYPEAAAAYESFRDLHPKHERVAHAFFRVAKSYFKDAPEEPTRDQSSSERAMSAYSEFLAKFPADASAAEARADLGALESRLGEKEWLVGEFYFKRGHYDAAKKRFERLIAQFPKTPAAEKASKAIQKIDSQSSTGAGGKP